MSKQRTKKLIKYVAPTVMSQVCFFLFTIVDGIFVGNGIGTDALGAVNIVMPFVMVANAINMLLMMGGVTVSAVRLGRGDSDGANNAFMHAFSAMAIASIIMSVLGMALSNPIGRMLGADASYIDYVTDYLFWYSVFIVPSSLSILFQGFCRNDGSPNLVMIAVIASSALNIFLDWLFIFPVGLGMKGAAIATGISQSVGMIIALLHFILKRGTMRFAKFTPSKKLYGKLFLRGLPETIAQLAVPIATLCMNRVLIVYTSNIGVNAFSVTSYVASFSMAIFYGVATGVQPLFGRSYGEKNDADLKFYLRAGAVINLVGSVAVYVVMIFIGGYVGKLFGADEDTSAFIAKVLPMYGWGFIIMSFNILISAYLYSTKRTKEAVIVNILRSVVFTISTILLLPPLFGGDIIWYTFGIYEVLSLIAAFIIMRVSERHGIIYR